jgi:hypothetical protein
MCFFMSAFILMFLSLILCESYNRILCVVYQYISILSGFPTDPVESWGSQQLLVLEVKWLLAPGEMARSSLGWTDRPRMHLLYVWIYNDIYISFISYGVSEKWGQKPSFPTVWNCSFRSKKKTHHVGAPHGQQMGGEGEPAHSPSRHAALFGDAILQS